MAGDAFDQPNQPTQASQAPTDVARLNAWLDAQLGRTLTIVALRRSDPADDDPLVGWRTQLQQFPRVRLLMEKAGDEEPVAEALARVAQRDPDTLLVCEGADGAAEAERHWRAAVLDAAEGRNLFERMLIALYGAGMTRAAARKQGFEDGFAPEQPFADALAILAREAVTRETYRRYGSSPPCYL